MSSYADASGLCSKVRSSGALPAAWTELAYGGLSRLRVRREHVWVAWEEPPQPDLAALAQALQGLLELAGGGSWSLVSETRYVYDGRRVIQERDGNNTPTVSYTRGRDLSGSLEGAGGIGGLLACSVHSTLNPQLSTPSYYHADGNGNVTFLLATNQTLAARYVYDPYGNTVTKTGTLADANVYRFSSKEHHDASGLYYYLYRWYDPATQRWINRDPIGETGGVNLYAFVGNEPAAWFDLFGLLRILWLVGHGDAYQPASHTNDWQAFKHLADIAKRQLFEDGSRATGDVLDIQQTASLEDFKKRSKGYDKVCLVVHGSLTTNTVTLGSQRLPRARLEQQVKGCSVFSCTPEGGINVEDAVVEMVKATRGHIKDVRPKVRRLSP